MRPEGGAKGGGLQTQRSDVKGEGETKGRRDDTTVVRAVCMVPLRPRAKRKKPSPWTLRHKCFTVRLSPHRGEHSGLGGGDLGQAVLRIRTDAESAKT